MGFISGFGLLCSCVEVCLVAEGVFLVLVYRFRCCFGMLVDGFGVPGF